MLRPGTVSGQGQELFLVPALVVGIGSLALPVVIVGLLLFGLPVAPLLRRDGRRPWVGVMATLWGAAAGKLMFAAMEFFLTSRDFDPLRLPSPDLGLCYSMSAALAWWWLERDRGRGTADVIR